MPYTVSYTQEAADQILTLPIKVQRQIKTKVERLSAGFTGNIKKLNATDNIYRLRSGDFRILFQISESSILILLIGDRKDIYG